MEHAFQVNRLMFGNEPALLSQSFLGRNKTDWTRKNEKNRGHLPLSLFDLHDKKTCCYEKVIYTSALR